MSTPFKTLLAVDGSPHALAAVRHALVRAAASSAPESFVLVNVQEPASLYEVVVAHDAERLADLKRSAGADVLSAAEALLDAAGAAYETEVAGGVPEHLLVELAENYGCDAIVVGALGLGAEPGATGLGRVTQAVLQASPVPVTVVRAPAPDEADDAAAAAEAQAASTGDDKVAGAEG